MIRHPMEKPMLAAFATGRLCPHLVSLGNVNGVTTDDSIALVPIMALRRGPTTMSGWRRT
jgi:hypothetical protein